MTIDIPRTIAVWAEASTRGGNMVMGADTPSGLPWKQDKADLAHFRETTRNHVLIMGRKTFEKLPAILKSRKSTIERPMVVLTSGPQSGNRIIDATPGAMIQPWYSARDTDGARELLQLLREGAFLEYRDKPVAVIGGAKVIELFEPFYSELVVTHMPGHHDGNALAPFDAFFESFAAHGSTTLLDSGARVNHFVHRTTNKEN